MSEYFDYSTGRLVSGTIARASDVNNTFDELDTGLDKLPTEADLKGGLINYAVDTGSADTYTVSLTYTPTSYTDGMQVIFKASAANTGACTINVDSMGAKSITRQDGSTPLAGDIAADKITEIRYNTTSGNFEIQGSIGATSGSGTMATQNASAVSITGGTLDAVDLTSPRFNSGSTLTVSSTLVNICVNSAVGPAISSGTAGRSLRVADLVVDDGTNASTIKCTVMNEANGFSISETDNISTTSGYFTLSSEYLTIATGAFTGSLITVLGVLRENFSGTASNVSVYYDSGNIQLRLTNLSGGGINWATAVDSGEFRIRLLYITSG